VSPFTKLPSVLALRVPTVTWSLADQEILALPLDELALAVLRDAHARSTWNWRNWMLETQQQCGVGTAAAEALAEAWTWLFTRNLVAWNPQQSAADSIRITRLGRQVLQEGMGYAKAVHRLDLELTPTLERAARPLFLRGDFELAAFAAMREVEVAVRDRAGLPNELIGQDLMRKALNPSSGVLADPTTHRSEAQALADLFAGAVGMFKNPPSHRRVDYASPTEAAETVLLADLLLRLLDKTPDGPGAGSDDPSGSGP
jgi:uncharacterized protein (TIGR02391 family)